MSGSDSRSSSSRAASPFLVEDALRREQLVANAKGPTSNPVGAIVSGLYVHIVIMQIAIIAGR